MTRYELEIFAHRRYGKVIGWMCNVINTSYSNPTIKIKGLIFLAFHDRVCPLSFSMDQILVDGKAVGWNKLEEFSNFFSEDEELMYCHLTLCSDYSAYTLAEAKLQKDSYHSAIQEAAKYLVSCGKSLKFENHIYGEYTYYTSYQDGTSVWQSAEGTQTVCYDFTRKILCCV